MISVKKRLSRPLSRSYFIWDTSIRPCTGFCSQRETIYMNLDACDETQKTFICWTSIQGGRLYSDADGNEKNLYDVTKKDICALKIAIEPNTFNWQSAIFVTIIISQYVMSTMSGSLKKVLDVYSHLDADVGKYYVSCRKSKLPPIILTFLLCKTSQLDASSHILLRSSVFLVYAKLARR